VLRSFAVKTRCTGDRLERRGVRTLFSSFLDLASAYYSYPRFVDLLASKGLEHGFDGVGASKKGIKCIQLGSCFCIKKQRGLPARAKTGIKEELYTSSIRGEGKEHEQTKTFCRKSSNG